MPATTRSRSHASPLARGREQRALQRAEKQQQQQQQQMRSGAVAKGAKKALRQRGPEFAFEIGKTETRPDGTTANLCSAPGCAHEARAHSRFNPSWNDHYPTDKFSTIEHWCGSATCLKLVCTLAGRDYRGTIMTPPDTPAELETAAPADSTPDLKFATSLHARLKTVERAQRGLTAFTSVHLEAYDSHARDHIPSDYSPTQPGYPSSIGYTPADYPGAADGYITPAYSPTSPSYSPSYSPVESMDAPSVDDDDQAYTIRREHLLGHPNEGGHTPSGIPGACARGSCAGCIRAGCYEQS